MIANQWPPPVNGMTADEIVKMIAVATAFLETLGEHLPEVCGREGHIWDNQAGREICYNEGGTWQEPDPSVFCDRGGYVGGEWVHRFIRTCTRCGHEENKSPVHSSPFT